MLPGYLSLASIEQHHKPANARQLSHSVGAGVGKVGLRLKWISPLWMVIVLALPAVRLSVSLHSVSPVILLRPRWMWLKWKMLFVHAASMKMLVIQSQKTAAANLLEKVQPQTESDGSSHSFKLGGTLKSSGPAYLWSLMPTVLEGPSSHLGSSGSKGKESLLNYSSYFGFFHLWENLFITIFFFYFLALASFALSEYRLIDANSDSCHYKVQLKALSCGSFIDQRRRPLCCQGNFSTGKLSIPRPPYLTHIPSPPWTSCRMLGKISQPHPNLSFLK